MSGMFAYMAGGLAKGLGEGLALDGRDRRDEVQKALDRASHSADTDKEIKSRQDISKLEIAAKSSDTDKLIAAHSADTQSEIGSKEKIAQLETGAAGARGMMAYSNVVTDEGTGDKFLVDPTGKSTPLLKGDGTPIKGALAGEAKDDPVKAMSAAVKAAADPMTGDVNWDTVSGILDASGVKYDKGSLDKLKAAASQAKDAAAAAKSDKPGIFSRALDSILGTSTPKKAADTTTPGAPTPGMGTPGVTDPTANPNPNADLKTGYATADDVKKAYANGKITKQKATEILRSDFGYE